MKRNLLFTILSGSTALCTPLLAHAAPQYKVGYIDRDAILARMPALADAETKMRSVQEQWQVPFRKGYSEYQAKMDELKKVREKKVLRPEVKKMQTEKLQRAVKAAELKLQEMQEKMRHEIQEKQRELIEPIMTSIEQATTKVAKAHGYSMVINNSEQIKLVVYAQPRDNLTAAVAKELKLPPAKPTGQK